VFIEKRELWCQFNSFRFTLSHSGNQKFNLIPFKKAHLFDFPPLLFILDLSNHVIALDWELETTLKRPIRFQKLLNNAKSSLSPEPLL